ncbi:MAG: exopolyphosphatase [Desulfococcaceae bacterium]
MRLITRPDPDGLISGVFLAEKGVIDQYKFVHPKVIQDERLKVTENDVVVNMPYARGCGLWFDHHANEVERMKNRKSEFRGGCRIAPSAAQVVWDYYGGADSFDPKLTDRLEAVNRYDSGILNMEDILNPREWVLLFILLDPRTGLGRFDDLQISRPLFMEKMILYCRRMQIGEILRLPEIRQIRQRYSEQQELYRKMLERSCEIRENIIVTNLLNEDVIFAGNRFLSYVLFPEQNIEIRLMQGPDKNRVVISCGHSILNRSSKTNVGRLMSEYGGGGHLQVGTCQIPAGEWERVTEEIIRKIRQSG